VARVPIHLMRSEILATVIRGDTIESVHRGHLIVIDGERRVLASVGDPETVTFFRSAAKPFQALPFITTSAADTFGYTEEEVALACASHSGEPVHVELAAKMLERAGFTEADLRCGAHLPFNEAEAERMLRASETPTQLHNNCSGKHAAMLALAKHVGADPKCYESPENPVQRMILDTVSLFAEFPREEIKIGTDGCAAPNFAIPVSAMARSFLNLIAPPKTFDEKTSDACRRIVSAMLNNPDLVGGTDRLDTTLMKTAPGKLISKIGAEGVWLCGVVPCKEHATGFSVALKIEDGDDKRARAVVSVDVLQQLGILSNGNLPELSPIPIKNRRGGVVGKIEATFELRHS